MSREAPIVVMGPSKGDLLLKPAGDKVSGTFAISLSGAGGPGCTVLYRLRVKASSIVFSKTYGVLDMTPSGSSNAISISADRSVAQSGHLSTIRVEYVAVSGAEADAIRTAGVDKSACRPFFQRSGVRTYDVACREQSGAGWLRYAAAASVVVGAVATALIVAKRARSASA